MFEFFHQVAAQYSNAVLVAILPLISDFVKKVELPMPLPITLDQVRQFRCWPVNDGDVGGAVILTNGLWVVYHHGHVDWFRTPRSYYNLQNPRDIPNFYGPLKFSAPEALKFARDTIGKLGYTLEDTFTDQEPVVDLPPHIGTNIVPYYQFKWEDPVFGGTAVSVEVDAKRKMVQAMGLRSRFFWRAPPKVAVDSGVPDRRPPITASVSNQFVSASLPKISEFAKKLQLPLKLSVAVQPVEKVEFIGSTNEAWLKLAAGQWFVLKHGIITGFYSPDRVFGGIPAAFDPLPRPLEQYLGRWNQSESDALELALQCIRKLGYAPKDFYTDRAPQVTKHEQVGPYVVPHYCFHWQTNNHEKGWVVARARVEIDANKMRLVSLELAGQAVAPQGEIEAIQTENQPLRTNRTQGLPLIYSPPKGATEAQLMEYLDKAMGHATNTTNRPVPQKKPSNPFE